MAAEHRVLHNPDQSRAVGMQVCAGGDAFHVFEQAQTDWPAPFVQISVGEYVVLGLHCVSTVGGIRAVYDQNLTSVICYQ